MPLPLVYGAVLAYFLAVGVLLLVLSGTLPTPDSKDALRRLIGRTGATRYRAALHTAASATDPNEAARLTGSLG